MFKKFKDWLCSKGLHNFRLVAVMQCRAPGVYRDDYKCWNCDEESYDYKD